MKNDNGTAYFLVHDKNFRKYSQGGAPFIEWLISEGFMFHEIYQNFGEHATGVWINLNNKIIACGKPGIRCFEEIGHHAITTDEFKTIYAIYKKYDGKAPFVFE